EVIQLRAKVEQLQQERNQLSSEMKVQVQSYEQRLSTVIRTAVNKEKSGEAASAPTRDKRVPITLGSNSSVRVGNTGSVLLANFHDVASFVELYVITGDPRSVTPSG